MLRKRNQEWLGIFIGGLGVLFLLVNNGLLWFGWEAVWPAFPLLLGVFLLKIHVTRRGPGQLFFGLLVTGLSLFLFLFSTGILGWSSMRSLWPMFFLITGISSLALAATGDRPLPALIAGLVIVITGVVGLLATSGRLGSRTITPLVRFWPLVLVVAGALIYFRARSERLEENDMAFLSRQNDGTPRAVSDKSVEKTGDTETTANDDDGESRSR
ncbi:MAG: hypothetical protein JSW50_07770 [Candidatus Latescibacterota bacterium]|nr:MAG: hypothetical protein JSW50_07770 [Candidatus Latescibacterota bacterium]